MKFWVENIRLGDGYGIIDAYNVVSETNRFILSPAHVEIIKEYIPKLFGKLCISKNHYDEYGDGYDKYMKTDNKYSYYSDLIWFLEQNNG